MDWVEGIISFLVIIHLPNMYKYMFAYFFNDMWSLAKAAPFEDVSCIFIFP